MLLLYGYRQPDFGVRARLWDGQTPDLDADELIVRDDGRSADLGYPWVAQVCGAAIVTYDQLIGVEIRGLSIPQTSSNPKVGLSVAIE